MMNAVSDITGRPVHRQAFLDAMAQFAHSVSIVATDGEAGRDGVVVSAVTSVSADTPLPTLLICLNQNGRVPRKLLANGVFSVSLLGDRQRMLADRFAGKSDLPREDWFADDFWQVGDHGVPVLNSALAVFECEVGQSSLVGSHHVIFGAVRAARIHSGGAPLVHAQRRYRTLFD